MPTIGSFSGPDVGAQANLSAKKQRSVRAAVGGAAIPKPGIAPSYQTGGRSDNLTKFPTMRTGVVVPPTGTPPTKLPVGIGDLKPGLIKPGFPIKKPVMPPDRFKPGIPVPKPITPPGGWLPGPRPLPQPIPGPRPLPQPIPGPGQLPAPQPQPPIDWGNMTQNQIPAAKYLISNGYVQVPGNSYRQGDYKMGSVITIGNRRFGVPSMSKANPLDSKLIGSWFKDPKLIPSAPPRYLPPRPKPPYTFDV